MTRSGEYFFIRFFSRPYKFCQKIISRAYENKFFLSSSNVICWTVNSEFWTEAALETSNEMWSYWPPASYQNHDRVCIHNIKFKCRYEIKKKIWEIQQNVSVPKILQFWSHEETQKYVLTSESGPLSAPGQEKETNSWHLLCTTKLQTARKERQVDVTVNPDIHIHLF